MSVIGIDFGNLNCVIAQAQRGGVDVLLNEASLRQTATCVSIQGKQRYMGDAAAIVARSNLRQTYTCMKRFIGRKFNEPEVQEELRNQAFDAVETPQGTVGVRVNYNDEEHILSMEQITAMMLFKLKQTAEAANNGVAVADVVLSVPTWYTDAQRRAMLDASEIAGLNVLALLNESTAVALSYGIYKSAKQLFDKEIPTHTMFLDLGHSTFTVTVVSFIIGQLHIRSCTTDRNLGSRDFDNLIVAHLVQEFKKRTNIDVSSNFKSLLKLQVAAEKAKKTLSPTGVSEAAINVECLHEDRDFSYILRREAFEEMCAPLLARLAEPIQQALRESGLAATDLANIEIVGGGARVEGVKKAVADVLGLDKTKQNFGLSTTLNADEATARGCALQCAILSKRFLVKPFNIQDSVTYPIKLAWESGVSSEVGAMDEEEEDAQMAAGDNSVTVFNRNDPSPKVRRVTFRKRERFNVSAHYDESALALLPPNTDLHLATFSVNVANNATETSRVRFNIRHNKSGMVEMASAQLMEEVNEEKESKEGGKADEGKTPQGKEGESEADKKKKKFRKVDLQVDATFNFGLSRADIQRAIELEATMAQQDRILRETADKRNELESYIYAMRDKIAGALQPFVPDNARGAFENALHEAESWLYSDEGFDTTKAAYTRKLEQLLAHGNPIEKRQWESEHRQAAISEFQAAIERYRAFVTSMDEAYAHIPTEERQKVREAASAAEGWMYDQLEAQGQLSMSQDPVLTVASIKARQKQLQDVAQPIMTKPKPAPKKEEKKADEKEQANKEVPMEQEQQPASEPAPANDETPMDEEIA